MKPSVLLWKEVSHGSIDWKHQCGYAQVIGERLRQHAHGLSVLNIDGVAALRLATQ